MDNEYEIYLNHCGSECPICDETCSSYEDGVCLLETPWFDCDRFQTAQWVEISSAELELFGSQRKEF